MGRLSRRHHRWRAGHEAFDQRPVIDEAALVAALQDRRIAGAGLDVFEDEPRVPEALFKLDNVVVVPHIASATVQTRQAMADRVFDNLQAWFSTGQAISDATR